MKNRKKKEKKERDKKENYTILFWTVFISVSKTQIEINTN